MDEEFWLTAWEQNRIGFHLPRVNPYLLKFWPGFNVKSGSQVFIPLCGKSLDMIWLRDEGYEVLGVELSHLAVEQFFGENQLSHEKVNAPPFRHYSSDRLEVLLGNYFDLTPAYTASVSIAYDRAALVALPSTMRPAYVAQFARLMPAGSQTFLSSFDYPQENMAGPPFSVSADEIATLYEPHFEIQPLATRDILAKSPRFAARGLTRFNQEMFLLRRR